MLIAAAAGDLRLTLLVFLVFFELSVKRFQSLDQSWVVVVQGRVQFVRQSQSLP